MSQVGKRALKVVKDECSNLIKKNNIAGSIAGNMTGNSSVLSPFAVELEIKSCVDKRLVAAFSDFAAESARLMGMTLTRGPAPLQPTLDQWTVLSSPFVHKTARTQFERRWHANAMRVEGIWSEEVGAKYVWYLKQHVPNEVELGIKIHERHAL